MPLAPVLLQLAAATAAADAPAATPQPDIQILARVRAKELTIEQQGEARVEVRADPPLVEKVDVQRNQPGVGRTVLRDLDVRLDARASVTDSLPQKTGTAGENPAATTTVGE